jgi:hypothetical protein
MSLKNIDLDDMKEPCKCNCGEWFDLKDGRPSLYSKNLICKTCSQDEEEEDSEDELEDEDSEEF